MSSQWLMKLFDLVFQIYWAARPVMPTGTLIAPKLFKLPSAPIWKIVMVCAPFPNAYMITHLGVALDLDTARADISPRLDRRRAMENLILSNLL